MEQISICVVNKSQQIKLSQAHKTIPSKPLTSVNLTQQARPCTTKNSLYLLEQSKKEEQNT